MDMHFEDQTTPIPDPPRPRVRILVLKLKPIIRGIVALHDVDILERESRTG